MAVKPHLEFRMAQVDNVDFAERIITVIAVPYEQAARVEYRGEWWDEIFCRTAFDGIENKQERVPVYEGHRYPDLPPPPYVGQTQTFYPQRTEGLVADLRMFPTEDGMRALQIANDDGFSASMGFAIRGSDQILNRQKMERRIKRAFIVDHIALVPQPAYPGAKVLSVRDASAPHDTTLLHTPALDEFVSDPMLQWAAERSQR